jgi:hypothetical protein
MGHPDWQNIHRADHTGLLLFAYMAPSSILYLKSPEQVLARPQLQAVILSSS